MTLLGIIALIAVVILGIMVLRVKSDPMEDESVRKFLSEKKAPTADSTKAESPEPKAESRTEP